MEYQSSEHSTQFLTIKIINKILHLKDKLNIFALLLTKTDLIVIAEKAIITSQYSKGITLI